MLIEVLANREHHEEAAYRQYCRRLFHCILEEIFASMKPHMTEPELALFPDGFYRRILHGFGAYLADYPEQLLCTDVRAGWCSRYVSIVTQ